MSGLPSRLLAALHDARPRGRAWWIIAAACIGGALVFLAVWLGQRGDGAASSQPAMSSPGEAPAGALAPLPSPLPAGASGASGIEYPAAPPAPPPPAPVDTNAQAGGTSAPDPSAGPAASGAPASAPRALSTPSPRYPRAALRRGESGVVVLRLHIGADGRTQGVDVVRSSGFARLDQAAVSAVRRWRFEPAMQDGRAVAGQLQVPIDFTPADG